MPASLWSRFQGMIYGSLLGEKLAGTTKNRLHKLQTLRIKIFECLVYSRTLECNILANEEEILKNLTLSEIGILVIPIILFFQENPRSLNQHISSIGLYLEKSQKELEIIEAWANINALVLRGSDWDEKFFFQLGVN